MRRASMKVWPIYVVLLVSAIGCATAVWFAVVASAGVGMRFLDAPAESTSPDVQAYMTALSHGAVLASSIFVLQLVALWLVFLAARRAKHLTIGCTG